MWCGNWKGTMVKELKKQKQKTWDLIGVPYICNNFQKVCFRGFWFELICLLPIFVIWNQDSFLNQSYYCKFLASKHLEWHNVLMESRGGDRLQNVCYLSSSLFSKFFNACKSSSKLLHLCNLNYFFSWLLKFYMSNFEVVISIEASSIFFLLCCLVDLSFNYCFSKFIKALAFMQPQIFFSWLLKFYMSNFEVFPWSSKFCVSNFEVVISIEASSILFLLCCVVDLSFN
jgi:hypothetical protein